MARPAGYVGFTVPQQLVLGTCTRNHFNAAHTPAVKNIFDMAASFVNGVVPGKPGVAPPPGFANGFSFFEFIIALNNLNGAGPFPPAGTILVAREKVDRTRIQPCGAAPRARKHTRYEKFSKSTDIQSAIVGCDAILCYNKTMEYAFIADPAPGVVVPATENAQTIPIGNLTPAEITGFENAITLRIELEWKYDKCNNPPNPPIGKVHSFTFTAKTLDPDQGGVETWSDTTTYTSN